MVNNNKLRTLFKDMSDYRITLKSVYSCPATETPKDVKLPDGWSLSWHQVATLEALRDPTIDVVFNTAMTGMGKAWRLIWRYFRESVLPSVFTQPTNLPVTKKPKLEDISNNSSLRMTRV
jgi:hypothetical protein